MNRQLTQLCGQMLLVLLVLLLSACGIRVTNGSGNVVSETRAVSDFDSVSFTGFGELSIVQGETEALTIATDDNLLPFIKTEVSGGILTIGLTDDSLHPVLRPSGSIRYELTVKSLAHLELSGAGTVEVAQVNADDFELGNSGAGEINVLQLVGEELTVELSGAGKVVVAGEVAQQIVELSGLGSYEAGDLASERATVMLSGAGSATVWASEQLDAEVSGVGGIRYYGSPQVNSQVSGVGNVQNLGNK